MNHLLSYPALLLASLGLAACSTFFPKDNAPKPVAAPEFKASASLEQLASFSVDDAGASVFEPLWLRGEVYAVGVDGKVKVSKPKGASRGLAFPSRLGSGIDGNEQLLLAAGPKGNILALAPDGRMLWKRDLKAEVLARPRVAGDSVFVRTQDGRLVALNAATGELRWQSEVKNPSLVLHVPGGMAFDENAVYAGFPGGRLRAYDKVAGKLLWEAPVAQPQGASELERMSDVVGDPWLDGEQICAVSYQGKVGCFDKARGEVRWSREFSSVSGLAGDHAHVYVTDASSTVVAFEKTTGRQVWKQDRLFARKVTGPAVFGKYVAVADYQGKVYLLEAESGEFAAMADVGDAVRVAPRIADESLLVQDEDGDVTLLKLR